MWTKDEPNADTEYVYIRSEIRWGDTCAENIQISQRPQSIIRQTQQRNPKEQGSRSDCIINSHSFDAGPPFARIGTVNRWDCFSLPQAPTQTVSHHLYSVEIDTCPTMVSIQSHTCSGRWCSHYPRSDMTARYRWKRGKKYVPRIPQHLHKLYGDSKCFSGSFITRPSLYLRIYYKTTSV